MLRKKKKNKLFGQVAMIVLMLLIVVGFTIPGFLNGNEDQDYAPEVEPRLCQSDADCYLTCDGIPLAVMCSQNLCLQNACDGYSVYPLEQEAITFSLNVNLDGVEQDPSIRANANNFFITFNGNQAKVFSRGLNLGYVLDKAQMRLDSYCLYLGTESYCNDAEKSVKLLVNGENSTQASTYLPKEGDKVEIIYS